MSIIALPGINTTRGFPCANISINEQKKSFAYSAGNRIYVVPDSYFVDSNSDAEIITISYHDERVTALCFTPDGSKLISGDESGRLLVTSPFHPDILKSIDRHAISAAIQSIDVDIDSNNCIVVGRKSEGAISVPVSCTLSLKTEANVGEIVGHGESILGCSIRPHRPYFAVTCGEDGQILMHKNMKYSFLTSCETISNKRANCIQYHPSGKYFAAAGTDKSITFYSGMIQKELINSPASTAKPVPVALRITNAHEMSVTALQFVKFGVEDYLVSVSSDKKLKVWRLYDLVEAPESNEMYPIVTNLKADLVSTITFSSTKTGNPEKMLCAVKCLMLPSDLVSPVLYVVAFDSTIFRIPLKSIIEAGANAAVNDIKDVKKILGPSRNIVACAADKDIETLCACSTTSAFIYKKNSANGSFWDSSYVLGITGSEVDYMEAAPNSQVLEIASHNGNFYGVCRASLFMIKKDDMESHKYYFVGTEQLDFYVLNKTNFIQFEENSDSCFPKIANEKFIKAIYHPNHNKFVLTGETNRVYIWNLETGELSIEVDLSNSQNQSGRAMLSLQAADIAFQTNYIAISIAPETQGKRAQVYVLKQNDCCSSPCRLQYKEKLNNAFDNGLYTTNFPNVNYMKFSPKGDKLAITGSDKRIVVYSVDDFLVADNESGINVTPTIGKGMDLHSGLVNKLSWINEDAYISMSTDGNVYTWNANTNGKAATIFKKYAKAPISCGSVVYSDLCAKEGKTGSIIAMSESGIAKIVDKVQVVW